MHKIDKVEPELGMTIEDIERYKKGMLERASTNCRTIRIAHRMSQDDLSKASGLSREMISKLEMGKCDPRLSSIAAIGAAFGFPPTKLLARTLSEFE